MANLTPTPSWDNVPQLETTTPALGGAGGPMNAPQQALLNRTEMLMQNSTGGYLNTTSWTRLPSIYKIIVTGVGSAVIDGKSLTDVVTSGITTLDVNGTESLYIVFNDDVSFVRATTTGTAKVMVV